MLLKKPPIFFFFVLLIWGGELSAQTACTTHVQNPSTAFTGCGTAVFQQDSVTLFWSNDK
jgi:hypothetical protein